MAAFSDQMGREWIVKIHAPMIEDIQSETTVNLRTMDALSELLNDPVALVNVLWVCIREQAQKNSITARSFGESLVGDSIEHAADALVKAYRDFCPASTRRLIDESMKNAAEIEAKREELQLATMAQNYRELQAKLDEAKALIVSKSVTVSPESSELTPTV